MLSSTAVRQHAGYQHHHHRNSRTRLKPGQGALNGGEALLHIIHSSSNSGNKRRKVCVRRRTRGTHVVQAGQQDPPQTPNPAPSNAPLEWVQQQAQVAAQAWRTSEARQVITQVLETSGMNTLLPPAAQAYAVPIFVASAAVEAALLLLVVRKVVGGWFKGKMQSDGEGSDADAKPGVGDQLGSVVAAAVGVPQQELEATIQGAAQSKRELQRLREQVKEAQIATEAMQKRLKTQLAHREDELSKALKAAADLQQELDKVQSVVLVREQELNDVQAAALKKADEAKAALKESQRKVALLEAMVHALRGKLLEEEEKNAQLTKAVRDRDLKITSLESQRSELVGRVEELRSQLATGQEQLKDAVDRCNTLETQVQQLEAQSKSLQAKVRSLEHKLQQQAEEARQAALSAEQRLAVLQAEATESDQAILKTRLVIEELEAEVQELRKRVQSQSATIRDKAEQNTELRQQIAASDEELSRKEDALEKARTIGQQLEERLAELARERAAELETVRTRLQRELLQTQRKSEETQTELTMVKKELFGVMMKLLGSVDNATDTLQKLPSEIRELLSPEAKQHEATRKSQQRTEGLQKDIIETKKALAALRESVLPKLSPHMRTNLAKAEEKLLAADKALQSTLSNASSTPVAKRRAQRDVQQAEADVEALYRSAMPLDVRQKDRNLRAQLRDKELELSTLTAEWVAEEGKSAALSELLAQKLQAESEAREAALKERLKQNEEDLQRWKQSEQQLREQIQQLEQSWKSELEAVQQSLAGSTVVDSPTGDATSKHALKIVVELRAVREQLQQQAEQVKKLRAIYADKVQGAQTNVGKARGQVTLLSENVSKLESELQEHETRIQSLCTEVGLPTSNGSETVEVEPIPVDDASSTPGQSVTSTSTSTAPAKTDPTPEGTVPAAMWGKTTPSTATTNDAASAVVKSASAFPNEEQLAKEVQTLAQSILGSAFSTFKAPAKDPPASSSTPPASSTTQFTPTSSPAATSTSTKASTPASTATAPASSQPSNGTASTSYNGSLGPSSNGTTSSSSSNGTISAPSRPAGGPPVSSRPSSVNATDTRRGGAAVAVETKVLRLTAAGCSLPSDAKVEKGGEDAHFVSTSGLGALGVADGVGGWLQDGVDPALYAQGLMKSCAEIVQETSSRKQQVNAVDLLEHAQRSVQVEGSSTICVAVMRDEGVLEVANLGDSSMRLIRGGKCLFATDIQEHQFNMPYQMGCPDFVSQTDTAADAELYNVQVQNGDVVLLGSDGLFDNVWDAQLEEIVTKHINTRSCDTQGAQELSRLLANTALQNARDPNFKSPWAVEAAKLGAVPLFQRMFPRGGKMDDVTAVVAFVTSP